MAQHENFDHTLGLVPREKMLPLASLPMTGSLTRDSVCGPYGHECIDADGINHAQQYLNELQDNVSNELGRIRLMSLRVKEARRLLDYRKRCAHKGQQQAIAWLHIPKCGTSFGTTLFHYANQSLPEGARMPSCSHDGQMLRAETSREELCLTKSPGKTQTRIRCPNVNHGPKENWPVRERCAYASAEAAFLNAFPLHDWFACRFWEKAGGLGAHAAISADTYAMFRSRFFGMFRSPVSRATSSYSWFKREFPTVKRNGRDVPLNATNYALSIRGTTVKMVAGQADGLQCSGGYVPCDTSIIPDVARASERLRNGFAFVGLTDEWALSICERTVCPNGSHTNTHPVVVVPHFGCVCFHVLM